MSWVYISIMTIRTETADVPSTYVNVLVWDYADWEQYNIADENGDLILVLDQTGMQISDTTRTEL